MAGRRSLQGDSQPSDENDAIRHLTDAVVRGRPWHVALLEAIALWTLPEENYNGHRYLYLIDGEAFDWLLLAERLCIEIGDAVPEDELHNLLFSGRLPQDIGDDEFREAIGNAKYHAYLNYLYGVTVEKFVLLAVEEEIRKERQARVLSTGGSGGEDAYQRLYGAGQETLLDLFRAEKGYERGDSIGLDELQEFTYWLFKYRLREHDKARVASDTAKGVAFLRRQRTDNGLSIPRRESSDIIEHGI
jgi:hypothetical protein